MALSAACADPQMPLPRETLDQLAELHKEAASAGAGEGGSFENIVDERRDLMRDVLFNYGVYDDSDWTSVAGEKGYHAELSTAFEDKEGHRWYLDESTLNETHPIFRSR